MGDPFDYAAKYLSAVGFINLVLGMELEADDAM
jgi:hypothetical protein